ncbi:MAG TPA: hypothetical protein VN519_06345 [Bryobacteraceae bacterium]|nr:hypothetical protein [Bryobacteraceae bacterium]
MTTETLTDAEINRRLADALGLDLTAKTDEDFRHALQGLNWDFRKSEHNIEWNHDDPKNPELIIPAEYQGFGSYTISNPLRVEIPHKVYDYQQAEQWIWDNREGQPWQSDLEAHVAAYRRTPPNWAGDLATAFTLGEEMRKRKLVLKYQEALWKCVAPDKRNRGGSKSWCWESISSDSAQSYWPGIMMAHATARQRALAALRTIEEATNDR